MKKKVALYGLLLAFGLLLSYIEALLLPPVFRPGLANLLGVFLLYKEGARPAALLNLLRILLIGMLFGNTMSLTFALCGGMCSLLAMIICKATHVFSPAGTSTAGGAAHNLGQTLIATAFMGRGVLRLLPVLTAIGAVFGFLVGYLTTRVLYALRNQKF